MKRKIHRLQLEVSSPLGLREVKARLHNLFGQQGMLAGDGEDNMIIAVRKIFEKEKTRAPEPESNQ